jgi:hypothetical protein
MSDLMQCRVVESEVRYAVSKLLGDTDAESSKSTPAAPATAPAAPASRPPLGDTAVAGRVPSAVAEPQPSRRAG